MEVIIVSKWIDNKGCCLCRGLLKEQEIVADLQSYFQFHFIVYSYYYKIYKKVSNRVNGDPV